MNLEDTQKELREEACKDICNESEKDCFESYKLYLLKRIFSVGYDEYDGKVIIASSAKAARKIANLKYGDEGPIWTDSNLVLCKEISLNNALVVLESFKAG